MGRRCKMSESGSGRPWRPRRGRPRLFLEWSTLRGWGKLPEDERDVPGYLLRLAREAAGLTQAELGRRAGMSQQAVSRAERWSSNPTIRLMRRWQAACGRRISLEP